ncbi:MAG: excisionase family DNA-binding protein [Proteobacteria bacterium]|nr:excisionase family DNA-binding protein [Pseudomonadota bacterium]MBU1714793.1 excisionase family DNA-binding protein [Pseudomonadota bacterium]
MDKIFIGVKEMAANMGISEKTIYRMLNDNQLPFAVKIGGQWRFRIDAVDGWLAARVGGEASVGAINPAVTVSASLASGAVLYRIHGENRDETIDELLSTLPQTGSLDFTGFKLLVLAREALASSSLCGVACMMPGQDQPIYPEKSLIILAFLETPTDFKALDGQRTEVVFLLLAANPLEQSILDTRLRRLLMEPEFVAALLLQPPRREVLQLVQETETRLLPPRLRSERKKIQTATAVG